MTRRWWVCGLGLRPNTVTYRFGGQSATATLSLLALLDLGNRLRWERPDEILALCTERAEAETLPQLRRGCLERGVDEAALQAVRVDEDPEKFLQVFLGSLPERGSSEPDLALTMDLTHGFRHMALLGYAAALYASALRPVKVDHCLYAKVTGGQGEFVDLTPLVMLPRWLHGLQVLEESGDAVVLARLIEEAAPGSMESRRMGEFATVLNWGAPVDVAEAAAAVNECSRELRHALGAYGLPLASEVSDRLVSLVDYFSCPDVSAGHKTAAKPKELTRALLDQHSRMVSAAFARGDQAAAAGLLCEWMVSWAWWNLVEADPARWGHWLRRECRTEASRRLNTLRKLGNDPELRLLLSEDQHRIVRVWSKVSEARNALMHNGMRRQWLLPDIEKSMSSLEEEWRSWLCWCPAVSFTIARDSGAVLVSAQGMSPGVLASAIGACDPRPTTVLCISSEEARPMVQQSLREAGFPHERLIERLLADPRGGAGEIDGLCRDSEVRRCLAAASLVQLNLTGGTTLMGAIVTSLGDLACGFSVPVRRFVLLEGQGGLPARAVALAPLCLGGESDE